MPVPRDSDFQTVSLVLTKGQVRRLRAIVDSRRTENVRPSFSEVARDIFGTGLDQITHARHTQINDIPTMVTPEAVPA